MICSSTQIDWLSNTFSLSIDSGLGGPADNEVAAVLGRAARSARRAAATAAATPAAAGRQGDNGEDEHGSWRGDLHSTLLETNRGAQYPTSAGLRP